MGQIRESWHLRCDESSGRAVETLTLCCFDRVTQKTSERRKINVWCATAIALQSAREFVLNGEHLDVVSKLKSFGIQLMCVSRRIRWVPLPLQTKASWIVCSGWTGCHVRIPCRWLHSQTDQFATHGCGCSSVVTTKRRSRCGEILR